MVHQKIERLIPYLSENFITYPLWVHRHKTLKDGRFI